MIYYWSIEKMLKELCEQHDIDASIKRVPMGMYNPMSYNFKEDLIKFNDYQINSIYENRYSNLLSAEDFVKIVAIHEIGHYLDLKMNPYKKISIKSTDLDLKIERELAAWSYGRKLVPGELLENYDMLNGENLMRYYRKKEIL